MFLFFSQNRPQIAPAPFAPELRPAGVVFPADTRWLSGMKIDFSDDVSSWELLSVRMGVVVRLEDGGTASIGVKYQSANINVWMPSNPGTIGRFCNIGFLCYNARGDSAEVELFISQDGK